MQSNNQTQKQGTASANHSQPSNDRGDTLQDPNIDSSKQRTNKDATQDQNRDFSKPKPKPPVQQPTKSMEKKEKEDFEADEREISDKNNRQEDKHGDQVYPKQKDNEGWKTGDSGIPENASDNPNS